MGVGWKHTPLYLPDPRDPEDVAEAALSHAIYGGVVWLGASAVAGTWAGPGHLGILYHAFFSPTNVGATAGTNALADTMFAMRVYSTPFRYAARLIAPIAIPLALNYAYDEMGGYRRDTEASWGSTADERQADSILDWGSRRMAQLF